MAWVQIPPKLWSSHNLSKSQFPLLSDEGNNMYLKSFLWRLSVKEDL